MTGALSIEAQAVPEGIPPSVNAPRTELKHVLNS